MKTIYKRPQELGRDKLLSLAMVMKDIQYAIDSQLTKSDKIFTKVEQYSTNKYFWLQDDYFSNDGARFNYNKEELKSIRAEMLEYLRSEGVIIGHDLIKETREKDPKIVDFIAYDFYGDWAVEVIQPGFSELYKEVIDLAESYIQAAVKESLNESSSKNITAQIININKLKVEPQNYNKSGHVLNVGGKLITISMQPKRTKETLEAKLLRMLFDVKYFYQGVGISQFYPVKDYKNARVQRKKARSLVAGINKKLPEELKGQELIKFDNTKFYINPAYK